MLKLVSAALLSASFLLCIPVMGQAQERCSDVHLLDSALRSRSISELQRVYLPGDYRSRLIIAYHSFELLPNVQTARRALGALPKTEDELAVWMTFGDSLCDGESVQEMKRLGMFGDSLPRLAAEAALRDPESMLAFVSFASIAVRDPHSDYAVQMTSVCKRNRKRFRAAVDELNPKDRTWFISGVFDPGTCRAMSLPESE